MTTNYAMPKLPPEIGPVANVPAGCRSRMVRMLALAISERDPMLRGTFLQQRPNSQEWKRIFHDLKNRFERGEPGISERRNGYTVTDETGNQFAAMTRNNNGFEFQVWTYDCFLETGGPFVGYAKK
jgi:hypothetical protein